MKEGTSFAQTLAREPLLPEEPLVGGSGQAFRELKRWWLVPSLVLLDIFLAIAAFLRKELTLSLNADVYGNLVKVNPSFTLLIAWLTAYFFSWFSP